MENKTYCVFCGQENNSKDNKCCKCGKELNPKENLLKEYLFNKTKEKFKGDIDDSIFNLLFNFFKSHLYGFVLTLSIVGVVIVNGMNYESYIEKVNEEPISSVQTIEVNYSEEQLEIKEVIDAYLYYARNIDGKENASEEIEKLKAPEIEIYNAAGRPVNRTFDVVEVETIDSVSYEYSLIDPEPNHDFTTVTQAYKNEGHIIGEVLVHETMKVGNETRKELFFITLSYINDSWYIIEAVSMDIPEENNSYVQDYLWLIGEITLVDFKEDYLLPEEFGYQFENDMKRQLNHEADYLHDWPMFELTQETDATKQLSSNGYKLAQTTVLEEENQYVITFVNIDAMWYVAEIVEYVG